MPIHKTALEASCVFQGQFYENSLYTYLDDYCLRIGELQQS